VIRTSLFLIALHCLSAQSPLSPQQARGRQIYERGASDSGQPIRAVIGTGEPIEGAILPCANCHGHDGKGKPEGGIAPSNLTWERLSSPYAAANPGGRTHPAYTERLLRRAFAMGIDPAGNQLNEVMPRFQMTLEDAADLAAYIRKLGHTVDPGLSPGVVRLGALLPPGEPGRMIREILFDYFQSVNKSGGIFNRRIEIVFKELPPDPAQRPAAVREFIESESIFAIACADFSGAESEIAAVLGQGEIPAVGAFASFPETGLPQNPWVFYLDGGVPAQIAALVVFAAARYGDKNRMPAIAYSPDPNSRQTALLLQAGLDRAGFGTALMTDRPPVPASAQLVFWLRGDVPGQLATGDVLLTTDSLSRPADSEGAVQEIWARTTTSAGILTEAMKRAGRALTRTSLLEALDSFDRVDNSLHTPITFGATQRVGSNNVRILTLDSEGKALIPVNGNLIAMPGRQTAGKSDQIR